MPESKSPATVVFRKSKWLWIALTSVFLGLLALSALIVLAISGGDNGRGEPAAQSPRVIDVRGPLTAITLLPNEWSPWLRLPPNRNFRVDPPQGECEVQFWSSELVVSVPDDGSPDWLGTIPHSVFRFRNSSGGEAVIHLDGLD